MKRNRRIIRNRKKKLIKAVHHNTVHECGARRNFCVEQFGWGMFQAALTDIEPDRQTLGWYQSAKLWDRLQTKIMFGCRNPLRGRGVYR